jgi:undecaprenyl diphosphate synthase
VATLQEIDTSAQLPGHIAIIMDGNGRWAKENGFRNRLRGHRAGAESIRKLLQSCEPLPEIRYLTLYAFSSENWKRPQHEIKGLMNLLMQFLRDNLDELDEKEVRLRIIGRRSQLSEAVLNALDAACARTKDNTRLTLTIALNYGARQEITDAVTRIAEDIAENLYSPADITEDTISSRLYAPDIPDPDFLIRTSGELRLSNFLLWQLSYAELYVTETYWPAFDQDAFYDALVHYQSRSRRYGGLTA